MRREGRLRNKDGGGGRGEGGGGGGGRKRHVEGGRSGTYLLT